MTAWEFVDHAAPFLSILASTITAFLIYVMSEAKKDRDLLKTDLQTFKLVVAKEYVANSNMRELEDRLAAMIERLGDRLDRVLDRAAK